MVCSDGSTDNIEKLPAKKREEKTLESKSSIKCRVNLCRAKLVSRGTHRPRKTIAVNADTVSGCQRKQINVTSFPIRPHTVRQFVVSSVFVYFREFSIIIFCRELKMGPEIDKFTVTRLSDYQNIKTELASRWSALENVPNTFRYKLNVRQQKTLDGRYGFFVQVSLAANTGTCGRLG